MSPRAKAADSQEVADWIVARKRFRLSDAKCSWLVELDLNPTKLGGLDNHNQEPWKQPLPESIEHLYLKRFGTS